MIDFIIQTIAAGLGTIGYALFFNNKKKRIPYVAIGGMITWCVYSFVQSQIDNQFISNCCGAIFATCYSEILARLQKSPATVFLIPTIIPLVPGGSLYYTMSYAVSGNKVLFEQYALFTFQITTGLAVGIIVVSVVLFHYYKIKNFRKT